MVRKNIKKCVTGGKERTDRAPAARAGFETVAVEVNYPDTAILLLKSPERPILLAAAAALARFGEKARENLKTLFDLRVVDSILDLIDHEDVFTQRFALKLLALMSAVQNVQTHLLKTDKYIVYFIEMLKQDNNDVFLLEFSSRILAELTSDYYGSALFLERYPDVSFLFARLKHEDPDVKKNCVETIINLLRDFEGVGAVTTSKEFNFNTIYELYKQPYPIIQEFALKVIGMLAEQNKDEELQETFRQTGGAKQLLDILDREDWQDLHDKVLEVIETACDNLKTAEFMNITDGTRRLFTFMETTENEKLRFAALCILLRLAELESGRKTLQARGIINFFAQYLASSSDTNVHAAVIQGLSKMSLYDRASDEITHLNPMQHIINLLNSEQATTMQRLTAAFALKELFNADYINCINFLDCNGQAHLMRYIQCDVRQPWEIQVTLVECLTAIADYTTIAHDLISLDLFTVLCAPFESEKRSSDELKIACCNALARFPLSEEARRVLILVKLPAKLYNLILITETVPVRNAASQLLLLMCGDKELAGLCGTEGYLVYMLKHRSVNAFVTTWDACIRALLNADLPMKFAYTGKLGLTDVTLDGFYVMRRSTCPFPVLEEIFRLKICPLEPLYVISFTDTKPTDHDLILETKHAAYEQARADLKRESLRRGLRVSEATINAWLEIKFGRVRPDKDLQRYLELFKTELKAHEKNEACKCGTKAPGLVEMSKIASRASFLGKFVARQLSGVNPETTAATCIDQQLELHLRELKESIETSVIPLGLLRVGSYLERAVLFKVMADQIALPASLVRGRYGKSWVEIAVPVVDEKCSKYCSSESLQDDRSTKLSWCVCSAGNTTALPCNYLRENYIVDLMHEPGALVPMDTEKAKHYCAERLCSEYACCG